MTFLHQLISAKQGDNYAVEFLLEMYRPLLVKEAIVDGMGFLTKIYIRSCVCSSVFASVSFVFDT